MLEGIRGEIYRTRAVSSRLFPWRFFSVGRRPPEACQWPEGTPLIHAYRAILPGPAVPAEEKADGGRF